MNIHRSTGLSLDVSQPLVLGGRYLWPLTDEISDLSFSKARIGGYTEASFSISGSPHAKLVDWYENGLGRDITCSNVSGLPCWNGFVNEVTIGFAGLSYKRGPLMDIGNRVTVLYSPYDTTKNPPVGGARTATLTMDDVASQRRYGIIEKIVSGGTVTTAEAEQARDAYLWDRCEPDLEQQMDVSGTDTPNIQVGCLGYYNWLDNYVYLQTADSGTLDLTTKLQAILTAEPNGIFTWGVADIEYNGILVAAYEGDYTQAWSIIKGLVELGNAQFGPCNFGVYADRRVRYESVDNTIVYHQPLYDNDRSVLYANGGRVDPWDVQPGKWILIPELGLGRTYQWDTLRRDPRTALIDTVQFSAPNGLQWSGVKYQTLAQQLAQMGLGGMG